MRGYNGELKRSACVYVYMCIPVSTLREDEFSRVGKILAWEF